MRMLVTGPSGLMGSEVVSHFHGFGWEVHGIDNNMRADFLVRKAIPARVITFVTFQISQRSELTIRSGALPGIRRIFFKRYARL
jgi:nucleoside-diphosphate-sugar epimerase